MRSSKLLRLPQRGALGNGLRVVAGAVLASEGSLAVITRNKRIELRPKADGTTTVVSVTAVEHPVGTRIEIGFGPALPRDDDPLAWVRAAAEIAHKGKSYDGKSSPFWYDPSQFHELILAHGSQPLRSLVAQLDGCTGGKAGEIVAAAGLDRMSCESVNRAPGDDAPVSGPQACAPGQPGATRMRRSRCLCRPFVCHRAEQRAPRQREAAG